MPIKEQRGLGSHQECQHILADCAGKKPVPWGGEPRRTEGLSSAALRLLVPGGSSPAALSAVGQSTAWLLQEDPKQGPKMAPSGNKG